MNLEPSLHPGQKMLTAPTGAREEVWPTRTGRAEGLGPGSGVWTSQPQEQVTSDRRRTITRLPDLPVLAGAADLIDEAVDECFRGVEVTPAPHFLGDLLGRPARAVGETG